MRLGLRSLFGVLVAIVLVACDSPTLPLPPPSPPSESAGITPGTVTLTGPPGSTESNALVVCQNSNAPTGSQDNATTALADGSWKMTITASKGDVVEILEIVGQSLSSITYTIMVGN